jgi:hypothetical protein
MGQRVRRRLDAADLLANDPGLTIGSSFSVGELRENRRLVWCAYCR